jgi:gluconate 2-dehydrogenase gamma chain
MPMAKDQNDTSRRRFLAGALALAPVAAALTAEGKAAADDRPAASAYKPSTFTAAEWDFVNAACARLIPADEHGPGAVEIGVPEFIDRQMGTPWADGAAWYMQGPFINSKPEFGYQSQLTPKQQYRLGIKAIDALCQAQHGRIFAGLTPEQQDGVLKEIEAGRLESDEIPLRTFFSAFLLRNVMEGYFGDPIYGGNRNMAAWKMIGYPGVRADYLDWVGVAKPYPYGPVSIKGERG